MTEATVPEGARTGADVLARLRAQPPQVWHRGRLVPDVTSEPGLARGVRSLAGLYDFQWEHAELLLDPPDAHGRRFGRSHGIPVSSDQLRGLGEAMDCSARYSMGMMGREPAYLNRAIAGFAASSAYFGAKDPAFGAHVQRYHAHVRGHDLALTHTLLNPRPNRLAGPARQADPDLAAHVVKERDGGIVVRGARMLATLPIADEIAVFPAKLIDGPEESARYAFAFAIPTSTDGLRFLCRDSVDYGFSSFDHPLGSRFEEMDAVVLFDDVFVPWERVFCYRDADLCNLAYSATGAVAHMAHQVVCKNIVKTEYLLGLVSLMIEDSGLDSFQHIQEKWSEIWVALETLKALRRCAEADGGPNAFGAWTPAWNPLDAARNLYPRLYPRMIEIVQQIGASGLVAMPTQADLEGPLGAEIHRYYQGARQEAAERIPLYRLAWDTAVSAFGSRQVLYERFFFGDPVLMAGNLYREKDKSRHMEAVRRFLRQSCEDAGKEGCE